jgi:NAD(P)-dependent dehydrogenase (short-subunit alcohol dehydrogenase family)
MGKLEDKIALITGGNSGIGFATAKQFVKEGAYVFITGRRESELAAAVEEIGSNVTGVQGDVSNLGDLDRLFAQIKREKGRLDIVFANAGVAKLAARVKMMNVHQMPWICHSTKLRTPWSRLTSRATIVMFTAAASASGTRYQKTGKSRLSTYQPAKHAAALLKAWIIQIWPQLWATRSSRVFWMTERMMPSAFSASSRFKASLLAGLRGRFVHSPPVVDTTSPDVRQEVARDLMKTRNPVRSPGDCGCT